MELHERSCVPCKGGVPPLSHDEVSNFLAQVPGWAAPRDHHLTKTFRFPDFKAALAFVDRVGAMAEQQGHHPDLHLAWGKVTVEIWTHKIDGLTESDFVFAAKCDRLAGTPTV
jgi:4a-hydroxytetrahydrobiopterin dehydratase